MRSNLPNEDPATLWQYYIRLTEIEQAFKELKHDLAIRPIYHQTDKRIEAHILIAFIAYCLHVTLKQRTRSCAPGLTPRAVVEKFATMQNGRRALAHHRWTSTGLAALHAAGLRPPTPLSATQAEYTGPTSAANLRLSPSPLSSALCLQHWLVDTLWARDAVGIIGGEPKCGKSFLALDLAVAVAAGVP